MKTWLFGVAVALLFVVVPADAANSLFSAPGGDADLGNMWLKHIFGGSDFTVTVPGVGAQNDPSVGGTVTTMGGSLPALFQRMAGMYSNAMLLLAVIILVYHLIAMVAHTAHDGKIMGNSANQIWTPVRLVFALGLLLPISGGFSSGQHLVFWIAKQGSGLASYIWGAPGVGIGNQFLTQGSKTVINPNTLPESMVDELYATGYCAKQKQMTLASNAPYYRGFAGEPLYPAAQNATAFEAQNIYNALVMPITPGGDPLAHPGATEITSKGKLIFGAIGGLVPGGQYEAWGLDKSCGSVVMPFDGADPNTGSNPDIAAVNALHQAHIAAFNRIEYPALQLGASVAAAESRREGAAGITIPVFNVTGLSDSPLTSGVGVKAARESILAAYRAEYQLALAGVPNLTYCTAGSPRGASTNPCSGVPDNQVVYMVVPSAADAALMTANPGLGGNTDLGWMSAGGYFVNMATKSSILGAAANLMPIVSSATSCEDEAGCPVAAKNQLLAQTNYEGEKSTLTDGFQGCSFSWGGVVDCLGDGLMEVMSYVGLANDKGQWLWHTQFTSPHPLSDMINLGDKLVNGSVRLFVIGIGANVIGSVAGLADSIGITFASKSKTGRGTMNVIETAGTFFKYMPTGRVLAVFQKAGAAIGALAPFFFGLAAIMFLPGVILFYVLPLLPFFNFLTGIITWMISLLQAVVAIPIIALAHITPHGEGLPSQSARGAYTMILQIFLRPVMMIFGLLACVLVMNTGIGILNTLFFGIYKFQLFSAATHILSSLIFFILYAFAAYGITNAAITAIDDFPLKAVQWIGGSSVDTNHDVSRIAGLAALYQANQAVNGVISGVQSSTTSMLGKASVDDGYKNMSKETTATAAASIRSGTAAQLPNATQTMAATEKVADYTPPPAPPTPATTPVADTTAPDGIKIDMPAPPP